MTGDYPKPKPFHDAVVLIDVPNTPDPELIKELLAITDPVEKTITKPHPKHDRHCLNCGSGDVNVCCVGCGDLCSCECDGCVAGRRLDQIRSLKEILAQTAKTLNQELEFISED